MEIIVCHISADFDALAAMVAASKLYPQAKMAFAGSPDQSVKDFMALHKDIFRIESSRDIDFNKSRKLIIVDTKVPSRLGEFRDLVNNPQIEVHIYDHHPPTQESISGDVNVMELVGATTTILLKKVREKKIPITPLEATLFAIGIYEETGSLTFTTTTSEDVEMAAWLLTQGANLSVVSNFVYHSLNEDQRKLLNSLILSSQVLNIHGFHILISSATSDKYVDEMALITHRLMDIERMDAVFTIAIMKDRLYIVGRSREQSIDVNEILAYFGGGGHSTAASASMKKKDINKVEEDLIEVFKKVVKPLLTAKDVMSFPVRFLDLDEDKTIADARKCIVKYGHSSLVVMQEGEIAGIISRRDIDKAIHHGFASSPISAYMSKPVISVPPDMPIGELQHIMIENDIGRIPVVEDGQLVGIVTRTDILITLHGRVQKRSSVERFETIENIRKLPEFLRFVLEVCGEVGDGEDIPVYAVGGFVRDLLLGFENLDVDIVAEGDGIYFAEKLAIRLGARVKTHEKFGTAIVILESGFKIDIASSRTEFYTRPAALPEVMESSIKQDLYRRDFTINAMSIKLNTRGFGQLLDFFGGQRDLKQGIVRVLHSLSFIEDPTRIFRAIRFEQRYNFKMDHHTESLLKDALSLKVFDRMTNERIRDEIILILSEAKPLPAVIRMDKLKILKLIHPEIHLNNKILEILQEVTGELAQFGNLMQEEKLEKWIIYFLALVSQLKNDQIREIAEKYRISSLQMKKLTFDREVLTGIIRKLSLKNIKASEIYRELNPLSLEVLLYLIARTSLLPVKQRVALYLNKLRKIKPLVRGRDLEAWGYTQGPFYKEALEAVWDAQVDGIIKTKEEAKKYLEEKFSSC